MWVTQTDILKYFLNIINFLEHQLVVKLTSPFMM